MLRCVLANRTLGFHPRSRGFDSRPEYEVIMLHPCQETSSNPGESQARSTFGYKLVGIPSSGERQQQIRGD